MEYLQDLWLWTTLPPTWVEYILWFSVWIVGAWLFLYLTEDDDDMGPADRMCLSALWPLLLPALIAVVVGTSPFWGPIVTYHYLFKQN